jgi:predicted transcriptional regulator of viral defense system
MLVRQMGIARARDLKAAGVTGAHLGRLVQEGLLERLARGQYRVVGTPASELDTLALAAQMVPRGIVCLLSALRFHDLGTQTPRDVWMLVGASAWRPANPAVPLRIVRSRDLHEETGVQSTVFDGVKARVTSPERTVIECFKFRSVVGLDVALEAMRDLLRRRRGRIDELWIMAKVFRMQNVMRPYLEAMG